MSVGLAGICDTVKVEVAVVVGVAVVEGGRVGVVDAKISEVIASANVDDKAVTAADPLLSSCELGAVAAKAKLASVMATMIDM
jgi:hypothetical protein